VTVLVSQGSRGRRTRHYTLVYDRDRALPRPPTPGRIIAPFLRASGLRRADGLIVSHQDLDHSGGALADADHADRWFAVVVACRASHCRARTGNTTAMA